MMDWRAMSSKDTIFNVKLILPKTELQYKCFHIGNRIYSGIVEVETPGRIEIIEKGGEW